LHAANVLNGSFEEIAGLPPLAPPSLLFLDVTGFSGFGQNDDRDLAGLEPANSAHGKALRDSPFFKTSGKLDSALSPHHALPPPFLDLVSKYGGLRLMQSFPHRCAP